jgi:hypothetical protein
MEREPTQPLSNGNDQRRELSLADVLVRGQVERVEHSGRNRVSEVGGT